MLGTLTILIGISGGIVTLLDLLLSEPQKEQFRTVIMRLWVKLDVYKELPYLEWLRNPRIRLGYVLSVTSLVIGIYLIVIFADARGDLNFFAWFALGWLLLMGIISVFAAWVLGQILRYDSAISIFSRAIGTLLIALLPAFAAYIFSLDASKSHPYDALTWIANHYVAVIAFVLSVLLSFMILSLVVVPFVLIYAAIFALTTAELLTRRIVEYPKGPVVAVSLIFTASGALLKALHG